METNELLAEYRDGLLKDFFGVRLQVDQRVVYRHGTRLKIGHVDVINMNLAVIWIRGIKRSILGRDIIVLAEQFG